MRLTILAGFEEGAFVGFVVTSAVRYSSLCSRAPLKFPSSIRCAITIKFMHLRFMVVSAYQKSGDGCINMKLAQIIQRTYYD